VPCHRGTCAASMLLVDDQQMVRGTHGAWWRRTAQRTRSPAVTAAAPRPRERPSR
jgi:hypothetical protein